MNEYTYFEYKLAKQIKAKKYQILRGLKFMVTYHLIDVCNMLMGT